MERSQILQGFLNILKPPGMTSHDVVSFLRKGLHPQKVGHLGTLDPPAAGVLPLAVGEATRLIEFVPSEPKVYIGEVFLGVETSTQDVSGTVTARGDSSGVTESQIRKVLEGLTGKILQVPPGVSAVHFCGRRLYEWYRRGLEVNVPPREVTVYALRLLDFRPPRALLEVRCSAGTYVRTLCHEIGRALGCGAHLSFLVRSASGRFTIENSLTLEEVSFILAEQKMQNVLLAPDDVLDHLPEIMLSPEKAHLVQKGRRLPVHEEAYAGISEGEFVRIKNTQGRLVAVGEVQDKGMKFVQPRKVFLR